MTSRSEVDKTYDRLKKEVQKKLTSLEDLQNEQVDDGRNISKQQKMTERFLAKRQMLLGRKDECNSNIRDLGVLPEEAFEKYISLKPESASQLGLPSWRFSKLTSVL